MHPIETIARLGPEQFRKVYYEADAVFPEGALKMAFHMNAIWASNILQTISEMGMNQFQEFVDYMEKSRVGRALTGGYNYSFPSMPFTRLKAL